MQVKWRRMEKPSPIVAIASLLFMISYFIFVGIVAGELSVLISIAAGLGPFALNGGIAIFFVIVVVELTWLMILNKSSPVILLYSAPFILTQIAIRQTVSSDAIR